MSHGWLTRPAREHPLAIAMLVLLVAAAVSLIVLADRHHHPAPSRPVTTPQAAAPPAVIGTRPAPPPLTVMQVSAARAAARRFLASYLPVLYGRANPRTIRDADPHVRAELTAAGRTPAAPGNRHPRITSLSTHSETSSALVLIAVITDGVQAPYQIVLQLTHEPDGWQVTQLANY